MRKYLIALFATMFVGAGAAFAQDVTMDQESYWAGVSAGYPGASVHFGVDNVVQDLAVRANLGYNYIGSGASFGVDGLYTLPVDLDAPGSSLYAGAGIGLGFGAGFDATLNVLGGGEFRLVDTDVPQIGIFGEVGPSISLTGDGFGFAGRLGANYHF